MHPHATHPLSMACDCHERPLPAPNEVASGRKAVAAAISDNRIVRFHLWSSTKSVIVTADRDKERSPAHDSYQVVEKKARAFALKHYKGFDILIVAPRTSGEKCLRVKKRLDSLLEGSLPNGLATGWKPGREKVQRDRAITLAVPWRHLYVAHSARQPRCFTRAFSSRPQIGKGGTRN
jgi:hypothetical protein